MNAFDRDSWEERWARALRDHPEQRPPNAHLREAVEGLGPGRALDAGCGHGSDALWLASRGWEVTGVDFSATALAHARSVAPEIDWIEADLGTWAPEPAGFDLVACIYVHVAGSMDEFLTRMATGVAPGGSLLLVGHPSAPGQVQVSVEQAVAALAGWELLVAEDRPSAQGRSEADAVIHARRT